MQELGPPSRGRLGVPPDENTAAGLPNTHSALRIRVEGVPSPTAD